MGVLTGNPVYPGFTVYSTSHSSNSSPVVDIILRTLTGNEYLFYFVNITDRSRRVELKFPEVQKIIRMSSRKVSIPDVVKQTGFDPEPFHLYSLRTTGTSIASISVNVHKLWKIDCCI